MISKTGIGAALWVNQALIAVAHAAEDGEPSMGLFGGGKVVAWLLVIVLLLLWMLTRVHQREVAARPRRRSPVSTEELARAVFEAAVSNDFSAYRGLFLAGSEARQVMGHMAQKYLDTRSPMAMKRALFHLHQVIPAGSTYGGVEMVNAGEYALLVQMPEEVMGRVVFGSAVQVGAIYRLVYHPKVKKG